MNKGIITFSNDNSGNSNNTRSKVNVIKNNDEQTNLIHNVNIGTTTVGDNNTSDGGTISINKQHPSYNSNESTPTSPTSSTSIPNVNNASSSSPVDMSSSSSSSSSSNMKQQPVTTERSTSVCGKGKGKATDNESPTNRTQAAFVNKLYKMLEDESIQHLINWSENGDLFSVSNPTAFSKLVLPQYFKHNNWQSFVRQLNMYGFHKVNDMIHSNLTSECQKWEFRHQNFRRGAVEELQNIKRKSAKSHHQYLSSSMAASPVSTSSMGRLLLGGNPNQQQQPHQSYQQHSIQHPGGGNPLDNKSNTNTSVDKLHSRTLYHQVIRLEDRMNKITQSHDSLKNETSELWSILSKQQVAMQDITDILVQLTREGNNNIQKDASK
ncbi:HSF-type DNA-binding-domain-containing protein [Chlamydoabsidia padenii]|nr:HSF-type DNA-binding-domain-containing protein [Chlamydoabsidia padenii]